MITHDELITGERIQLLCDHYIGNPGCITNTMIITATKDRFLKEPIENKFNNRSKVFCYTHTLNTKEINILKKFNNPFVLYCHNSDHSFEEQHLKLFSDLPNLKFIYSQNMNVTHPKINFLPIGIANSQWQHGNINCWKNVLSQHPFLKSKDFYFNFKIRTNPKERQQCYDSLKNKITWIKGSHYQSYLNNLKHYKFSICPIGNGIDTHRLWESLYLEVIPIVKRSLLAKRLIDLKFPIVIIDSWNDFNPEKVIVTYEKYDWEILKELQLSKFRSLDLEI